MLSGTERCNFSVLGLRLMSNASRFPAPYSKLTARVGCGIGTFLSCEHNLNHADLLCSDVIPHLARPRFEADVECFALPSTLQ